MARVQLRELDAQRTAAVQRLCRDDLAVDTLLDERGRDAPPSLDYERLFRGSMDAAGLQALWVLDSLSGEVLATGHRNRILGNEGAELTRQARSAGERPFVLLLGAQEHQRFLVSACSIARGGARLTLVGGSSFLGASEPRSSAARDHRTSRRGRRVGRRADGRRRRDAERPRLAPKARPARPTASIVDCLRCRVGARTRTSFWWATSIVGCDRRSTS